MSLQRRQLLIDTSVLLEILRVPYESDRHRATVEQFDLYVAEGVHLRIPAATVLETGAHVRRIDNEHHRRTCAHAFVGFLTSALTGEAPRSFLNFEWTEAVISNMIAGQGHHYPLE
ncbi:MAG: hypothetical protein IPK37_04260 [Austwickia sp.]|jgi:hypothetical protein|nr:MAG: hypothetical protein IPK37_04260 [Austwickia sp.]